MPRLGRSRPAALYLLLKRVVWLARPPVTGPLNCTITVFTLSCTITGGD